MRSVAVALMAIILFSAHALASGGYPAPMPSSDPRFPLEDLSFEYTVRNNRTRVEGSVANESGEYLSSVQFSVEFFDYYGYSLGSSFANYAQFENGATEAFRVTLRNSDATGAAFYEVKVVSSTPALPRPRRRSGPQAPSPAP